MKLNIDNRFDIFKKTLIYDDVFKNPKTIKIDLSGWFEITIFIR